MIPPRRGGDCGGSGGHAAAMAHHALRIGNADSFQLRQQRELLQEAQADLQSITRAREIEIAAQPDRADDVLYKLRAIIMGVRSDGLVKANEEFAAWLTGLGQP